MKKVVDGLNSLKEVDPKINERLGEGIGRIAGEIHNLDTNINRAFPSGAQTFKAGLSTMASGAETTVDEIILQLKTIDPAIGNAAEAAAKKAKQSKLGERSVPEAFKTWIAGLDELNKAYGPTLNNIITDSFDSSTANTNKGMKSQVELLRTLGADVTEEQAKQAKVALGNLSTLFNDMSKGTRAKLLDSVDMSATDMTSLMSRLSDDVAQASDPLRPLLAGPEIKVSQARSTPQAAALVNNMKSLTNTLSKQGKKGNNKLEAKLEALSVVLAEATKVYSSNSTINLNLEGDLGILVDKITSKISPEGKTISFTTETGTKQV